MFDFKPLIANLDQSAIQKYFLIIDLMKCKLSGENDKFAYPQKQKKQRKENYMKVKFINKGVEMVNLSRILNLKDVISTLPFSSFNQKKLAIPSICYSYNPPIRSKVLNYSKVLKEFRLDDEEVFPPCNCHSSEFKDPFHNHIITGNLDIIKNDRLRNLMRKGWGYREDPVIRWKSVKKEIHHSVIQLVHSFSKKYNMSEAHFHEFAWKIMEHVEYQIRNCKDRYQFKTKFIPVLKDQSVLTELESLHQQYVFTPVDKASKNIAIMCKSFYLQTIFNELKSGEGEVYKSTSMSEEDIVKKHHDFTKQFSFSRLPEFTKIPSIYMIPKFHKNPIKFRYIVASKSCSSKPISNAICKGLAKVRKERKNYCQKLEKYDGINRYWVVESNQPILDCVNKLNSTETAKSVTTYDFSNLYTSLPHEEILETISIMVDDVFRSREKKRLPLKLAVSKSSKTDKLFHSAYWVSKPRPDTFFFTAESLKDSVKFLLDHTFFNFGGRVFQQKLGIPIGTDAGPELATGHLHQCEYSHLDRTKKINIYEARKTNNSFRYVDDIDSFQSGNLIGEKATEIYGTKLTLNKENEGTLQAHVLDLSLSIKADNTIDCNLFDKRRAFDFEIVQFPDLTGCIPSKNAYGIIVSQLQRYYKACSNLSDFVENTVLLINILLGKSFKRTAIFKKVKYFLTSMKPLKYATNAATVLDRIFPITNTEH